MRRLRRRLLWFLVVGAGLLVVLAAAGGLAYLLLRQSREAPTQWLDPMSAIAPDEVAADLALYPLAGASELEAIDASVDTGEFQAALALLSCSLDISDRQRVGRLAALGDRSAAAQQAAVAGIAFQQIRDIAVLSARLNDPLRADALREAAEGWTSLGEAAKALAAYQQMQLIAEQSPYLQTAQRRHLLGVALEAYRSLGESELAEQVQAALRDLDAAPRGGSGVRQAASPDLPFGSEPVSSPEVGALEEARRQAAFAVVEALSQSPEPAQPVVDRLAEALKAEDAAKSALYQTELELTSQSGRRIEVGWEMVRWQLTKYCIADRAFGLSIVPEWESQLPEIQLGLSKVYEGLQFDYEDLVTALPDPSHTAPGQYEVRRMLALAGRLGQYPNYPAGQLTEKLTAAAGQVLAAGNVSDLYVDATAEGGDARFWLRPGAEYGRPEEP